MPDSEKTIVIIAGTQRRGETPFARAFLAQSDMRFINAWVCYDNSSNKTVWLASGENE